MRLKVTRTINRVILIALIITMFQLTFFTSGISAEDDVIYIKEVDERREYSREVSPGETTTYNWTLRNEDPFNATYNVSIEIDDGNSDWGVMVEPDTPFTIEPTKYKMVTLTVVAPSDKDKGKINVTLSFTIWDNEGNKVQEEERSALTSLSVLAPPEEKKVLDLFENPLPEPLDNEFGIFLLTVIFWLIGSLILVFLLDPVVKAFTLKTKTQIDDIVLRIIRTPLLFLVFFYGFVSSLKILDDHIPSSILDIVGALYGIAAVLILFYVAYKLFKDILVYYGELVAERTASNIDDVIIPIVEKIGVVIIGLLALGYLLGYMNIDLTVFVAGGVVISMVIAFAAQETLSNFFAGIFILTDRPFQEGDTIILPDTDWYEVRDIGLRSTRLFRYKDASLISIPNNKLAGDMIINFSNPHDKTRARLTFGVGYGSDPDKVKNIILDVANRTPHVITDDEEKKPFVKFTAHGESSLNFLLQVIVDDRAERWGAIDHILTEVYKRFNEEGIEIPFPQRTVWLKKEKGGKDA
jgi:small-conductance mechanosensitive channel